MIEDVCVYIQRMLMQPSTQDIIERLRTNQVCTAHQCFESVDDMIPMTMPVEQHGGFPLMMFVAAILLLLGLKPRNLVTTKSGGPAPPPPSSASAF
tara:strand:+ start:1018 stop:1305 length:288 start_codon:yes stop_codon:yes gene_type:complete